MLKIKKGVNALSFYNQYKKHELYKAFSAARIGKMKC